MRATISLILLTLFCATAASAQRTSIGIFSNWGAFRDPAGCLALSEAYGSRASRPAVSVSYRPERGVRGQLHFRLSREKRQGSAILLRIDDRTFQLVGGGINAWAPNARADADIVAAMRVGVQMNVETRSVRGGVIRDHYALRGAATAIDAAAIGCAKRS